MEIYYHKSFASHNQESHAEGAYRLKDFEPYHTGCSVEGAIENIRVIHPEGYIRRIEEACMNREVVAEVQLTPSSWEAALIAVNLTVRASRTGAFAAVRPPGHHAGREKAMGFCLFNNIAIATQLLVHEGKKVFIFDFDAHHGNGTQDIFYDSGRVFYCSTHQAFGWPMTGDPALTGTGPGKGTTLNIPLYAGGGDKPFLKAVDQAVAAIHRFEPDVVAVSAGFDGYENDRLMDLGISLKGFYECGFKIGRAAKKVFAVLEGGYHEDILPCVRNFCEGIEVGSRPVPDRYNHEMSIG
ncbi:MAG: histone deacetylase [Bacteroidales bacterium]